MKKFKIQINNRMFDHENKKVYASSRLRAIYKTLNKGHY